MSIYASEFFTDITAMDTPMNLPYSQLLYYSKQFQDLTSGTSTTFDELYFHSLTAEYTSNVDYINSFSNVIKTFYPFYLMSYPSVAAGTDMGFSPINEDRNLPIDTSIYHNGKTSRTWTFSPLELNSPYSVGKWCVTKGYASATPGQGVGGQTSLCIYPEFGSYAAPSELSVTH